jgi:hypothetical protein
LVFWDVMLLFPMFRRHVDIIEGQALQDPGNMKELCVTVGFCSEVAAENSALLGYYAASSDGKKLPLLAA